MRKKYYNILCSVLLLAYHSTAVDGGCEGDDICKCDQTECRSATEPKACKTVEDACSGMKFKENQCQRKGAYYSWGGAICRHDKDSGNCDDYEKLVKAINFGGRKHTDINGITYEADPNITSRVLDQKHMRRESVKMDYEIVGVPEEDKHLYESYITSDQSHITKFGRGFVGYKIPMKEEKFGDYELTLKFVEPEYNKPYKRNFDVLFHGKEIFKAQDIVSYSGRKGAVFELHVPFSYVDEGGTPHIFLFGMKQGRPTHMGLPLVQFFSGECGEDSTFAVSALSVKYLGENWKPSGNPKPKRTKRDTKDKKPKVCKSKKANKPSKEKPTTKKPEESEESNAPIGGRTMG